MKMWNFSRKRHAAGNICLVVFTAFLLTMLSPMISVGNAEAAPVASIGSGTSNADPVTFTKNGDDQFEIGFEVAFTDPLTPTDFTNMFVNFAFGQVYFSEMASAYETIYDGVYKVVYSLVYTVPTATDFIYNQVITAAIYGSSNEPLTLYLKSIWQPPSTAVAVTGVTLDKTSTYIKVGWSETLAAIVAPANATDKAVTWTSSDPTVATVSSTGVVTGVSKGTSVITVTTVDGNKQANCSVTVTKSSGSSNGSSNTTVSVPGLAELITEFEKTSPTMLAEIKGHWAVYEILLMVKKDVAKGYPDGTFKPESTVTRAQFAAFLQRALGLKSAAPTQASFKDVESGAWYYGAVEAAKAAGLVKGYENGGFKPEGLITRQEMATMVTNALKASGKNTTLAATDMDAALTKFTDSKGISDWAKEAAAIAVKEGIVNGRTDTQYVPNANASRAEGVVMIKRVLGNLNKL